MTWLETMASPYAVNAAPWETLPGADSTRFTAVNHQRLFGYALRRAHCLNALMLRMAEISLETLPGSVI